MMIIMSVKEPSFLLAVNGIVSGVEVEDQMLGRLRMGRDELIDEDFTDANEGLALDAILQPTERGGRRQ